MRTNTLLVTAKSIGRIAAMIDGTTIAMIAGTIGVTTEMTATTGIANA